MVMFFANTFQSPYYEHLMGNASQYFYEAVRIIERIEQPIKMKKIKGLTMDFRTITRDELEDDSQVGNLSCVVN